MITFAVLALAAAIAAVGVYRTLRLIMILIRWDRTPGRVVGYVGWYATIEYQPKENGTFVTHYIVGPGLAGFVERPKIGSVWMVKFNPSAPKSASAMTIQHYFEPLLWAAQAYVFFKAAGI